MKPMVLLIACLLMIGCCTDPTDTSETIEVKVIERVAEPYEERYYNGQTLVENPLTGERRIIIGVYGQPGDVVRIRLFWWRRES